MSELPAICDKCGAAISNDFGVTLAFCTNCGKSLSIDPDRFLDRRSVPSKPRSRTVAILGGIIFLGAVSAVSITGYVYFSRRGVAADRVNSGVPVLQNTPAPPRASIDQSDLTQISFMNASSGPLGLGDFTGSSLLVSFSKYGLAHKLIKKINYHDGNIVSRTETEYKAKLTEKQFADLARLVAENHISDQADNDEGINDAGTSFLIIRWGDSEKRIKTSIVGKDGPQIEKVLAAMKGITEDAVWEEVRSRPSAKE